MPNSEDFDLRAFQDKVLKEMKTLQTLVFMKEEYAESPRAAASPDDKRAGQFIGSVLDKLFKWLLRGSIVDLKEYKRIDESTSRARLFLREQKTRQILCPVLQEIENNLSKLALRSIEIDAGEIASAITPVLAPLAQAKAITIPLDPLHFALGAWMIARTGIAKYCAGQDRTA
jgi:hypothetical protein